MNPNFGLFLFSQGIVAFLVFCSDLVFPSFSSKFGWLIFSSLFSNISKEYNIVAPKCCLSECNVSICSLVLFSSELCSNLHYHSLWSPSCLSVSFLAFVLILSWTCTQDILNQTDLLLEVNTSTPFTPDLDLGLCVKESWDFFPTQWVVLKQIQT